MLLNPEEDIWIGMAQERIDKTSGKNHKSPTD